MECVLECEVIQVEVLFIILFIVGATYLFVSRLKELKGKWRGTQDRLRPRGFTRFYTSEVFDNTFDLMHQFVAVNQEQKLLILGNFSRDTEREVSFDDVRSLKLIQSTHPEGPKNWSGWQLQFMLRDPDDPLFSSVYGSDHDKAKLHFAAISALLDMTPLS